MNKRAATIITTIHSSNIDASRFAQTKQYSFRPILSSICVFGAALGSAQIALAAVDLSDASTQTTAVSAEEMSVLPVIVVQATRTQDTLQATAASVQVIDAATIQNNQLQVNLSESLQRIPGILVQNRQNYAQDLQISMRGFGARSTFGVRGIRLYVDDIPASMPDGQGQTSNIDLTSIKKIEVLNGSLSSLYGNSSGGVIQAYTEDGDNPPSLTAQLAAGSNRSYRYAVKAQGGQQGNAPAYVLSATRFTTDGYRDHSQATKNIVNSKLSWALQDGSSLKLIINHVDIEADDPLGLSRAQWQQNPRMVDPAALTFNTRKTVAQTQAGAVYEKPLSEQHTIRLMTYVGQRDTTQYQSIPVFVQTQKAGWEGHAGGVIDLQRLYYGADLRWTARDVIPGQQSTLIAGLAYDAMQEQRQGFENFVGTGNTQQLGIEGKLRRNEDNDLYNIDPYLQAAWHFLPDWRLDAGLRYGTVHFNSDDHYIATHNGDDSGKASYRKLLPSASVDWALHSRVNLYASYGRGFETPTFNEISYRPDGATGLNFDLRPSVNDTSEVGAKTRLGKGLLTTALFYTKTRDEIITAGNSNGRATFQNAGNTQRQGVELAWNGKLYEDLKGTLSYSALQAEYKETTTSFKSGNTIAGVAKQSAYAALDWQPQQGWQFGADVRYLGRVYVNDQNTDYAPAYTVTSAYTGYVWQYRDWTLRSHVRVDNLFDKKYSGSVIVNESNGRYFEPAQERTWNAGLALSFRY